MKYRILFVLIFLNSLLLSAKDIYVSPKGNDANNGTITSPIESIKKAQELAATGDIVYIRGGLYIMRQEQIEQYKGIWAYTTNLSKNGVSYLAYKNEKPVFDYKNINPDGYRIIAFLVNGSNIYIKGIEVVNVQVTIKTHTQSECFEIRGSNNTLEQLKMHDNMAIGVYMLTGSNNLILNCDAYNNWDSVSEGGRGGNTDGFGAHLKKGSVNNIFRGCRAWFNSDDGFDLINNAEPLLIENCWAFYNGYTPDFVSRGDGNGFKAGGYAKGRNPYDNVVANFTPIPRNTIRFCLAVGNKQGGFYANHHLEGNYWYNNTAYKNRVNYDMLNCVALNLTDFGTDGPGWNHELVNNLGFAAKARELANIDKSRCVLKTNYFDLADGSVTASDFLSLDETLLTAPRQADGSLPNNDFLRLAPSSKLINAGTDIGFPFTGTAPDLGCFEQKIKNKKNHTIKE
ncbi:right-handed parallel beta-helix repeat-containing protein [Flavobacterium sp. WC2509]|uniref:right-handed parallel beta-helix repeat-containing protein n=1 Tax=Flavobacterium sp. WC2509 TaxID=3461406 RepID=UPI004044F22D